MSGDFLILLDQPNRSNWTEIPDRTLRDLGLHLCMKTGRARIFKSTKTPLIRIADGSAIVGNLFTRSFHRIPDGTELPSVSHNTPTYSQLIGQYWGDYLFVSAGANDDYPMTILRAPFGRMPCIYSIHDGIGFITSDVSIATSLGLYEKRIDWDFIPHSLAYTHLKTQRTALDGLRELLPGSLMHLRDTTLTVEQTWSPWDYVRPDRPQSDLHIVAAELQHTIAGVVAAWARTDESVLMELSGGLDSSIIASCLHGTNAKVSCCTLVTPIPGADERQYARLVAASIGAELHVVRLRFEDARIDFLPRSEAVVPRVAALQYAVDQVVGSVADHTGVTALYSGGGGDTVFCYLNTASPAADAIRERGVRSGLAAIRNISDLHQCTRWHSGRLALKKLIGAPQGLPHPDTSFLSPNIAPATPDHHPWFDAPTDALPGDRERIFDLVGTQLYGDGASRGRQRRLRFPLLSQPVVEYCLGVPTWLWIRNGMNRSIARAAFSDRLPGDIINRRSKGNFVHYSGTVYQQNRSRILPFLLDGQLQRNGLLDTAALERFLNTALQPRDERFLRVLDLCMVENWIRHHA